MNFALKTELFVSFIMNNVHSPFTFVLLKSSCKLCETKSNETEQWISL